jgi:hypothetical protein
VYSSLLFPSATQTCCSENEDSVEFFDGLYIHVDYGAFRYFASVRVVYSFDRQYSSNNYTLFVTFGIIVNTFVCMCEKKCS